MSKKEGVADNAFNQAVGKVRRFAERVGKYTKIAKLTKKMIVCYFLHVKLFGAV